MSYQKQNFINYLHNNNYANPGAYCNALDNIEKLFLADVDAEFEKDQCESLYNKIQQTRKNPEQIGKSEHDVRTYASRLKKYIEFRHSENVENSLEKEFELWMTEQPQLRSPNKLYSSNMIQTFVRILKNGGERFECIHLGYSNFFHISDLDEFKKIYNSSYTIASFKDEQGGYRDYKDSLDFYLKFLKEINEEPFEKNIRKLIVNYKKEFTKIDKEERYKWEAIKHYKDNWNIDAPDFASMVEQAFAKTFNLLTAGQYFARKMLVKFSQEHPEEVRKLFKILYDESLPLAERFDSFRAGFDSFIEGQKINHYQDLHAVSVYLTFEYPEKYCIYKYSVWTDFLKNIGEPLPNVKGKHETFKIVHINEICDKILNLVNEDRELRSMSQSRLNRDCYDDPTFRLLAFDIMFFGSYYINKDIMSNEVSSSEILTIDESGVDCFDALVAYAKTDFLKDVYISEEKYETCVSRLKHKKNLILQGAPGVGKTFAARRLAWSVMGVKDDNRIQFVQFHQSYSYEDFIMGYKPDGNGFSLEKGIFYDFCIKASEDPVNDYFFIIDEINRGNMSKIFGELLMLIENDYRGMEITLAYDKKPFSVPENLYIIGMMNTADRSLAMIDYALRRRFSFVEMTPGFDSEGFESYQSTISNHTFGKLIGRIKALNADIENDASLGKGFCIGHSYFCNLKDDCSDAVLKEIVEYDIVPMLEEYWFDDEAKAKNWSNDLSGVFNG